MSSFSRLIVAGLIVMASSNGIAGQGSSGTSYLFPTDASHQINSGFGDYRSSHFHGGIDISTNGKIGYPVYAAKSGYVYRVSVSPFGYGKMIILRHDDSTYTLYGHLSAFAGEIKERVEEAQRSEGKYNVDLTPGPGGIRVERGEIIARTGATGVGGPHLHFEVHGKDYSFVDPLVYKSLDVSGYRTPRIFGVAAEEISSGTTYSSRVIRTKKGYRARTVFRMNGPFFFVIHAADSYGRGKYKRPPKYIRLSIDGREFLSLDMTRFPADDYLDVASLVDLRLSRGYKTYYKLCVDRAIPFPSFTPSAPLSGLVGGGFQNGRHDYSITVSDEDGNSATVSGEFFLNLRSATEDPVDIEPFVGRVVRPTPALTLDFPRDAFLKDVDLEVSMISPTSFRISANGQRLRKKVRLTWKVSDPKLLLFERGRRRWSYVPCENKGGVLTAEVGYGTGEFGLLRDDTPPLVQRVYVSRRNPFYVSVAPTEFKRDFVYFRVSDNLSNVNTDEILLKLGSKSYFCEYDVDKHAAICKVDADLIRHEKRAEIIVYDHAGNERRVVSELRMR